MNGMDQQVSDDNHRDDHIDDKVFDSLNLYDPKSFYLFAGAGSGKTRTLVNVLERLILQRDDIRRRLSLRGQQIGVITYTNAARDEIITRLQSNPYVHVSTIHSFAWMLVEHFSDDIKPWLKDALNDDIVDLNNKLSKARDRNNKTNQGRIKKIASKERRIGRLPTIERFTYSPDEDNTSRDALQHEEVIGVCSHFLKTKPVMQELLVGRFPILLIDESQDTKKKFMEALFEVQCMHKEKFCLGLIGDAMQQVYLDGIHGLNGVAEEHGLNSLAKKMNHRSRPRIIGLINRIRSDADRLEQQPRSDHPNDGVVRLFILASDTLDKKDEEQRVRKHMAKITDDIQWYGTDSDVMAMTVEHHMAARRLGFDAMFMPLYVTPKLRNGLLRGTLPELRLFSEKILPLIHFQKLDDHFATMSLLNKESPLMDVDALKKQDSDQPLPLDKVQDAVKALMDLFGESLSPPTFGQVLRCVHANRLFPVPSNLRPFCSESYEESQQDGIDSEGHRMHGNDIDAHSVLDDPSIARTQDMDDEDEMQEEEEKALDAAAVADAWAEVLETPFNQMEPYRDYVNSEADFDTHQGVKGREFPRVMGILDDAEMRGFTFSYEELLTGKGSKRAGRTRRLFYVVCSRAMHSLAIVAYTENPNLVRTLAIDKEWFAENEIVMMNEHIDSA
ncbi:UvrD-helicase domain-containing protein [Magnetococcales bacterium HHB-1]